MHMLLELLPAGYDDYYQDHNHYQDHNNTLAMPSHTRILQTARTRSMRHKAHILDKSRPKRLHMQLELLRLPTIITMHDDHKQGDYYNNPGAHDNDQSDDDHDHYDQVDYHNDYAAHTHL
jgi:hypothetical protein